MGDEVTGNPAHVSFDSLVGAVMSGAATPSSAGPLVVQSCGQDAVVFIGQRPMNLSGNTM
jgi:hypothetical protein